MSANATNQESLLQAIDTLRAEVSLLSNRVAVLERANRQQVAPVEELPKKSNAHDSPVVDEALICAISAALAAYLGVQPRIRQIHLVGGAFWAQQGRVTIQASHAFAVRHG